MNRTVIVHGPAGCGKTRNAEKLMRHFGMNRIVDDWTPSALCPIRGALVLTNSDVGGIRSDCVEIIPFAEAAQMAGIA